MNCRISMGKWFVPHNNQFGGFQTAVLFLKMIGLENGPDATKMSLIEGGIFSFNLKKNSLTHIQPNNYHYLPMWVLKTFFLMVRGSGSGPSLRMGKVRIRILQLHYRIQTASENLSNFYYKKPSFVQCCGSGSGIRCLFDPRIRDLEQVFPDCKAIFLRAQ